MVVNSVRLLMDIISIRVVHSLREGNTLADFLTNLVFDFAGVLNLEGLIKSQWGVSLILTRRELRILEEILMIHNKTTIT